MLKLKFISRDNGKIVFNYYPEGKEKYGSISINEETGEINILNMADNDEFGTYKIHAVKKMKEYFQNKNFLAEDIVAWY